MTWNLCALAVRFGEWQESVGLPWEYFAKRGCILDCRGPLVIDPESYWGFGVTVLTESHDIAGGPGTLGPVIPRGVVVDKGAWIGSNVLLVGCHIGEGSVVAAGSVVRCQDVAPGVIVAGNPARVIARWNRDHWDYEQEAESGFGRRLE